IAAAAYALAAGDPLGALNRVALRNDAPALALRGTAMAQLGELDRARTLVRRAGRAFGSANTVARAMYCRRGRDCVSRTRPGLATRGTGRGTRDTGSTP